MHTDTFQASVQYNDWGGSTAADDADMQNLLKWLETNNHIQKNEFLLGIRMSVGENHGTHKDPVFVEFLFDTPGDYDSVKEKIDAENSRIEVRRVSVEMPLAEFFGFFKRFEVTISRDKMLENSEYEYHD